MSSIINDENIDHFHYSQSSFNNSQIDSGYFSFTSPCRLSPSNVIYNQQDSPISESNHSSPINFSIQKFHSNIDYENYVNTRKYFDILTQINHRNAYHLIDEIFQYLSRKDLLSCLLVCHKWNIISKDYSRRKQTKHVKRNLFENIHKLTSTPMQLINNRIPIKNNNLLHDQTINDNIHLKASTMTFRYGYLKYLHGPTITKRCPLCSFVSIVDVNDQHGVCTNPLCGNNFCQCCSGPYHPSSPCKISTGPIRSPWRKRTSISPIFSNKTRNNLRRLLI